MNDNGQHLENRGGEKTPKTGIRRIRSSVGVLKPDSAVDPGEAGTFETWEETNWGRGGYQHEGLGLADTGRVDRVTEDNRPNLVQGIPRDVIERNRQRWRDPNNRMLVRLETDEEVATRLHEQQVSQLTTVDADTMFAKWLGERKTKSYGIPEVWSRQLEEMVNNQEMGEQIHQLVVDKLIGLVRRSGGEAKLGPDADGLDQYLHAPDLREDLFGWVIEALNGNDEVARGIQHGDRTVRLTDDLLSQALLVLEAPLYHADSSNFSGLLSERWQVRGKIADLAVSERPNEKSSGDRTGFRRLFGGVTRNSRGTH